MAMAINNATHSQNVANTNQSAQVHRHHHHHPQQQQVGNQTAQTNPQQLQNQATPSGKNINIKA